MIVVRRRRQINASHQISALNMHKARLISARVTETAAGMVLSPTGKTGTIPRQFITLISSATACASGRAPAYQVNDCPSSERNSVRLLICSCFSGASSQAALAAGFTCRGTVCNPGTCSCQIRRFAEGPGVPSDLFHLQRTSISISPRYPDLLYAPPAGMDGSQNYGNPGAPQIQGETSRSTEGPTPQQWQHVKEEIKELYRDKPLKEVRAILEHRHGFRATYVLSRFPSLSPTFLASSHPNGTPANGFR